MPELEFTIDQATGELRVRVRGVAGPACDDIARLARELLGAPAREEETAEYRLRPRTRPQVRSGGDGRP
ncbi:MAG TPA: DUF2997 domain-containing protein [Thermomicrobiales bacterium]|nr:DUF2997 domain-containing protein [Thermomicrobiales bacterium]